MSFDPDVGPAPVRLAAAHAAGVRREHGLAWAMGYRGVQDLQKQLTQ